MGVKRLSILLAAIIALGGCAAQRTPVTPPVPPPAKDWTITATWNEDFTNFKPCSTTVTVGCVTGFTWGYMQGSNEVPLKTSPASVCTGTAQPEVCSDTANALLGIGSVTFYCIANYIDNSGAPGATGSDNSAAQDISLGTPTNLVVTKQ